MRGIFNKKSEAKYIGGLFVLEFRGSVTARIDE